MKIMLCHDSSEMAEKALEKTVDRFKSQKPDIVLLCVDEDILDTSSEEDRITEEYRQEHGEVLHKSAEWVAGKGLEVHVMRATGDPRRMIMEAIEKQTPDIVVVARKERSKLESIFQKSISTYLVKNARCDVMVMSSA